MAPAARSVRPVGSNFVDEKGRNVQFRGINVGGNSKMPATPQGFTWRRENLAEFYNHKEVSFVGRPFPLEEADEHFARLKRWGFTLLRFVITWEAVEHGGPGVYDTDYLDYLHTVLQKASDLGFSLWIDPHQDAWSRFTGGSGAPGWTLEVAGFDITKLEQTGAGVIHQTYGDPFPHMIWPTNYTKLACATMFMLFYAGEELAPKTMVEGENIQTYLQRHYLNAMVKVAKCVTDIPGVVGYGSMNEPNMAWIGLEDLNSYKWELQLGPCCTPFQSMHLGHGVSATVPVYDHGPLGFKNLGARVINPDGVRVWKEGYDDIWEANGVMGYEDGKPKLLRPQHFYATDDGRKINFYQDYFVPFGKRFIKAIHEVQPDAWIFIEDAPFAVKGMPHMAWPSAQGENLVCADHWYDGITLVTKSFKSWLAWDGDGIQIGPWAQPAREKGIRDIQKKALSNMGGVPSIVGETGIPFDLYGGKAFRTGNFRQQELALDAVMRALEVCFANVAYWNYTSDNSNHRGDNWNGEDLSIFSVDQMTGSGGLDDGGRALKAVVRPYARCWEGTPLRQTFNMDTKCFRFSFSSSQKVETNTEVFVPEYHYPNGYEVKVSDGKVVKDPTSQILTWVHGGGTEEVHDIYIFDPKVRKPFPWPIYVIVCILLAVLVRIIWVALENAD